MKRIAAMGALAAFAIAGCQGSPEKRDAHQTPASQINRNAADEILAMPDDFPNVASKCSRFGYRVFVITHNGDHGSGFLVVIKDPACAGVR